MDAALRDDLREFLAAADSQEASALLYRLNETERQDDDAQLELMPCGEAL